MSENLLLIAKIGKPHGVYGTVKLVSFAESMDSYQNIDALFIKKQDGSYTPLHIKSVGTSGGSIILAFDEIKSKEEAEGMADCELFIEMSSLGDLPDGEYYHFQLIGMGVVTTEGDLIGKVKEVMPTVSNDILVVKGEKNVEKLIPVIKKVVKKIDLKSGKITIEPFDI